MNRREIFNDCLPLLWDSCCCNEAISGICHFPAFFSSIYLWFSKVTCRKAAYLPVTPGWVNSAPSGMSGPTLKLTLRREPVWGCAKQSIASIPVASHYLWLWWWLKWGVLICQHYWLYYNHEDKCQYMFRLSHSVRKKKEPDLNNENLWHQDDQSFIIYPIGEFNSIQGHQLCNMLILSIRLSAACCNCNSKTSIIGSYSSDHYLIFHQTDLCVKS